MHHSEMVWPEGGRAMVSSRERDCGSRGFSITDPEGNRWSFGTYAGSD